MAKEQEEKKDEKIKEADFSEDVKEPKDMTVDELMPKPQSHGWLVGLIIILCIILFASVLTRGFNDFTFSGVIKIPEQQKVPIDTAVEKAMLYINTNILKAPNQGININATEANGVYRFTLMVGNQTFDSYVTTDGKLLFPAALALPESTQ